MFLDHPQRRSTVGRTPLDEWSARRRDLYLTTHGTHNRQTSMPWMGIRTHDLSRRAAADLRLRPRGYWDRLLINIAVPNTHNLAKTITDKQNKYQELSNEICAMWKQNTAQVIPLVISSTGVNPKSLPQSLKRLNLHSNTYIQMQKFSLLGSWNHTNKAYGGAEVMPRALTL